MSSTTNLRPQPVIPDHELVRQVGRGGYGEVWLARNMMGRFRAVKVVYRDSFSSDRPYERELGGLEKFEPVSRGHPNLVSILHVGKNDERAYFYCVMEAADDVQAGSEVVPASYQPRTLSSELARRGRLGFSESVRLGMALCGALEHLHSRNLIHRDIKPSNIIYVDGSPKLADIGLVTHIGTQATYVGTEGYIPPEGPGSPSADLFSLGKVLYEASMGKRQEDFPELPTRLRDDPEFDALMRLNGVVMKACDLQPGRRFRSADEMLAALSQLQAEFPDLSETTGARTPVALESVLLLVDATSNSDIAFARSVSQRLSAVGFRVSLEDKIELTADWARRVEQELRTAKAVVAVLSPGAVSNEAITYALEVASQGRETGKGARLIPLTRGSFNPPPLYRDVILGGATICELDPTRNVEEQVSEFTSFALARLQEGTPKRN